jgi:signal peptidase I
MPESLDTSDALLSYLRGNLPDHPVRIPMRGSSMLPAIRHGDRIVITRRDPRQIEVGEIVLFIVGGRLILHRVAYVEEVAGKVCFLTKGDNCQILDDWVVDEGAILGSTEPRLA